MARPSTSQDTTTTESTSGETTGEDSDTTTAADSGKLWRDDGRCGFDSGTNKNNTLPNGELGQCDPTANGNEEGPCCSDLGWCGNSDAHCKCPTCVNFADSSTTDSTSGETTTTDSGETTAEDTDGTTANSLNHPPGRY